MKADVEYGMIDEVLRRMKNESKAQNAMTL
jgi:hypothetical protein